MKAIGRGSHCKSLLVGDDQSFCEDLLIGFEEGNDGFSDFLVWDAPSMVSLDDLIVSTDKTHNFHALDVPPLPKDRNLSCGQHKQEILRQLCELAKSEPTINQHSDAHVNHYLEVDENQDNFRIQHQEQAYQHEEGHAIFKGSEARTCTWGNDGINAINDVCPSPSPWLSEINFDESGLNSDTKSVIRSNVNHSATKCNSLFPTGTDSTSVPQKVSSHEFTAADRVSAVSRYKEKKRTRRFEKHIDTSRGRFKQKTE